MARQLGATRIIAVDVVKERLDVAERFGANNCICLDRDAKAPTGQRLTKWKKSTLLLKSAEYGGDGTDAG